MCETDQTLTLHARGPGYGRLGCDHVVELISLIACLKGKCFTTWYVCFNYFISLQGRFMQLLIYIALYMGIIRVASLYIK